MMLNLEPLKKMFFAITTLMSCFLVWGQGDTSTFKVQFAIGVNSPSVEGFVSNFEPKSISLPTFNFGAQYMFRPKFGAKLDFGFNRFTNLDNTPEFKINYTRINAQLVYDASRLFNFVIPRIGIFTHIGPGFTFINPLGNYTENNTSFFNAMGGLELHYALLDAVSVYLDGSYILAYSDEFKPVSSGFGSFNGNILTVTIGLSLSLSGCYFCERR